MTRTTKRTILAALVAVAALLIAWQALAYRVRAERALATRTVDRQRVPVLLRMAANAPWATGAVKTRLEELAADIRREEAAAPKRSLPSDDGTFGLTRILKDPKLQNTYFQFLRAEAALRLGAFFRARNLTDEQIAQFLDARIRFFETHHDLLALKLAQDPEAAADPAILMLLRIQEATGGAISATKYFANQDPAVDSLLRNALTDMERADKAILGDDGYEALESYQRTLPVRGGIQRFASAAAMIGCPLTIDQTERLVEVLAHAAPEFAKGEPMDGMRSIDWLVAEAAAKEILTSEQMRLFTHTDLVRKGDWKGSLNRSIHDALFAMPAAK